MFSRNPVHKLSTATTSSPRSRKLRHRCDPRNPAPPVMTTLICDPPRRMQSRSGAWPPDREDYEHPRRPASASRPGPRAKSSQRNSSHSVSTATTSAPATASYASAQISSCGTSRRACSAGRRVERPDGRAGVAQPPRDRDRRRVAQVVGFGLEREPPHRDHRVGVRGRRVRCRRRHARSCRRCGRAAPGSPHRRRRAARSRSPAARAVCRSAATSFGKHDPPYPGPGCRNWNPMRSS